MEKTLIEIEVKDGGLIAELMRLGREAAERRGDSNCIICARHGFHIIHPPHMLVLLAQGNSFDGVCLEHYKRLK